MRLLKFGENGEIHLVGPLLSVDDLKYAILSHTWGKEEEEVSFQEMRDGTGDTKQGYLKIKGCMEQAKKDGLDYSWVDTCCIDKSSSAELQEAINSMFKWYSSAERCYAYLSDASRDADDQSFRNSKWFTRGWTLQELLAPKTVEFFDSKWNRIGSKSDAALEAAISEITRVPTPAIRGANLSAYGVQDRIDWLSGRKTSREEDQAYCLFGLLGVFLPVIYGEGKDHAMKRLKREAGQRNTAGAGSAGDKTLAWRFGPESLLHSDGISGSAPCFVECEEDLIVMWRARENPLPPFLDVWLPFEDHKLWWTTLRRADRGEVLRDPPKWVHQNVESQERPAIAAMQDQLVAAWKGVDNSALYFSTLRPSNGADQWAPPLPIPHAASSTGPSLASLDSELRGSKVVYALWKGCDNNKLYLSTYDGNSWRLPTELRFANTDVNSTLVAYEGKIVVSWKQSGSENLYWMFLAADGSPLMEPHEIGREGTSRLGPTLAVVDGTLCAAWKGMGDPADVRVSTWRRGNNGFGFAQTVHNSWTRRAPTLASWGDTLVLAWRGDDREKTMWWMNGELRVPTDTAERLGWDC